MKKLLCLSVLALSVIGNLALVFVVFDTASRLDGATTSNDILWKRRQLALQIINHKWVGVPAQELKEFARQIESEGHLVGFYEDSVEIDEFVFRTKEGFIEGVEDFDSPKD